MNIALFGTSADPPTLGHSKILTWLSQHYDQVAIWAADNPFKQHHASLEHRNAMLQTLAQELEPDNIRFMAELSHRRSVLTVTLAHQLWPEADLTLVIGSDLVAQFPSWYQSQELLNQARLLVVPRPGTPLTEGSLSPLKKLGARVSIAEMEGLEVSSTAYREYGLAGILSPAVEDYIHRAHLYNDTQQRIVHQIPVQPAFLVKPLSESESPSESSSDPTPVPV